MPQYVINASLSGPTVPDADVDSVASFLGNLYIVSQYTVRLMTPCIWRILCLHNSSYVPYFRLPLNLPTAARRNRKCTECSMTAFGRNRMSAKSAHLSTFGAETEAEIWSTSIRHNIWHMKTGWMDWATGRWRPSLYSSQLEWINREANKKLSYCWETVRVVKTAHSFWPVNRHQKDRLTAAAYTAVKVGYMTL